jgi:hypothetical protein
MNAVLCATGVGAACLMALVHRALADERTDRRRRAADIESVLSRQIASKEDYGDSNLSELRGRVERFRRQLGPDDAWMRLVRQFGLRWAAEQGPKEDKDGYSIQVGTFLLTSPAASDWPEIIEAVGAAEQLPGVDVKGFEMRSTGSRKSRSVDTVKVVVTIHARLSGPSK